MSVKWLTAATETEEEQCVCIVQSSLERACLWISVMDHIWVKASKRGRPEFAVNMSNPEGMLIRAEVKDKGMQQALGTSRTQTFPV